MSNICLMDLNSTTLTSAQLVKPQGLTRHFCLRRGLWSREQYLRATRWPCILTQITPLRCRPRRPHSPWHWRKGGMLGLIYLKKCNLSLWITVRCFFHCGHLPPISILFHTTLLAISHVSLSFTMSKCHSHRWYCSTYQTIIMGVSSYFLTNFISLHHHP